MTAQCRECLEIWNISKNADNHMYLCPTCTTKRKSSLSSGKDKGATNKKTQGKNTKNYRKRKGGTIVSI